MAVPVGAIIQFIAAAAMLALAGWLLVLRFQSRVNRAFSLFLIVMAVGIILLRVGTLVGDARAQAYLHVSSYAALALPWTLVWFIAAARHGLSAGRRRAVLAISVLGAAATLLLFALDHCSYRCFPDGIGATAHFGPLDIVASSTRLLMAAAGLVFLRSARQEAPWARAHHLLAIAFFLAVILEGAVWTTQVAAEGIAASSWRAVSTILTIGALAPAAIGIRMQWAAGFRTQYPIQVRNATIAYAAAAVAGIGVGMDALATPVALALYGFMRLLMPVLATIALVRHRLFDLDARIRWALARGFLAAVAVAVFFGVSELAVAYFQDRTQSSVVGILVAAPLVFFLAPLHHMSERLAHAVAPAAMGDNERIRLYRDQVAHVWMDGVMGRKERLLLDNLRERLGVPPDEAYRIEGEIAGRIPAGIK